MIRDSFYRGDFYKGKKVLVTGHTGFKGSWLTLWLLEMGATVIGFSIDSPYENGLHEKAIKMQESMWDFRGDVADKKLLNQIFKEHQPEIVFHLAAQPLVRLSYDQPQWTFQSNALGTANVLDAIKNTPSVKAAVMITTDKVYKNKEQIWGYKETDELGGSDPYSASKVCAEVIIQSYQDSFFKHSKTNIASVRAGNVLGGGDWAPDRIITDAINALEEGKPIQLRNPLAVRPWQHVLEPLSGYLLVAKKLYEDEITYGNWNFGPHKDLVINVQQLVESLIDKFGYGSWEHTCAEVETKKKECNILILDCTKAEKELAWKPRLNFDKTMNYLVEWYKNYKTKNVYQLSRVQIKLYEQVI